MRAPARRLLVCAATAAATVAGLATAPVGVASPSPATASSGGAAVSRNVIVLLKNQHATLRPAQGPGNATRAQAIATDQSQVLAQARKLGASHIQAYNVVNAVSLTVKSNQLAALSANPDVAAVVPDLPIPAAPAAPVQSSGAAPATAPSNQVPFDSYCSSDQTKPGLEPEALQNMHVADPDPATPAANDLETGAGVKVGYLADGIDINNPDFIRADGSHVFSDYQDFSGDGTDAVSSGAEAFGDASAIAAQGRTVYNVQDFTNPASPLPGPCYIRVQGVAPGATLVGLKVFGNSDFAPTSHFIAAIQYAVTVAGVDVLNQSFGANPYPDNMDDPITLADDAAIEAGVTVVSSTGDSGTTGTMGSPGTSDGVITAGGTTAYRSAVQTSVDGFTFNDASKLKITGWADNQISSISSGGYAQDGKVPDVVAEADSGWALCTPTALYTGCVNSAGTPSSIQNFGGTSQSSPLVAGVAALVVGAYEKAHGGARPTPEVVKSILTGTATDLGAPAYEQGAGEVNALAAVQAALSIPAPGSSTVPATAAGTGLATSTARAGLDQLDLSGPVGSTVRGRFTVTNASRFRQTISLTTRQQTRRLSDQTGSFTLDPNQTFPNVAGAARAYQIVPVKVPVGADRLVAQVASNTAGNSMFVALVDPHGIYQSYNIPQGAANYSNSDVVHPTPGTWSMLIWANPKATNPFHYEVSTWRNSATGRVSPSRVTLDPGRSATVSASFPTDRAPGDDSAAVLMSTGLGQQSDLAVSIRTTIPTGRAQNTFTGALTGGNGRASGEGQVGPAQSFTYYADVPARRPALNVDLTFKPQQAGANEIVVDYLIAPDGTMRSAKSNVAPTADGKYAYGTGITDTVLNPRPGRWRFIVELVDPTAGVVVNQPFTATLSYATPKVSVSGVPHGATLLSGRKYYATLTYRNTTPESLPLTLDPRLDRTTSYPLASQTPGDDQQQVTLPDPKTNPSWFVPTGTTSATFYANATLPVGIDVSYGYGEPEVYGPAAGDAAQVTVASGGTISNGPWNADIGEPGPFDGPAPSGTVAANATVQTLAFDGAAGSDLGDFQLTALTPAPAAAASTASGTGLLTASASRALTREQSLVRTAAGRVTAARSPGTPSCASLAGILPSGQSCTVTIEFVPSGASGSTVRGTLHLQDIDVFGNTVDDLTAIPYSYRIR